MELKADICYRAVKSRDPRFDGRFFTGVKTTGIYCRPVCPAVTPRRRNVAFFPCASAAEKAGFRPCKRCRPETSPGTPAWLGTSASVSRALRYIGEGCLDQGSVDDLAARLGLGPRHLTRLFEDHLGTTPVAVAQTRRVHFARNLIRETNLPMARIALAAGFGSVKRFNVLIKQVYGATPTQLRQRAATVGDTGDNLVYRLAYRPPYDWDQVAGFLAGRAIPGVEEVTDQSYRRTFEMNGAGGMFEVAPLPGADSLLLRVSLPDLEGAIGLVGHVRRMFDCGADTAAIGAHLGRDPLLKPLVRRRPGLRLPSAWDPFEMTVRAILGQQISVKGATTIAGRLVERLGTPLASPSAGLTHLFPSPATVAAGDLSGIGLTAKRMESVRKLAAAVADGSLVLDAPLGVADFVERMVTLSGIGPWTAHYVAMRALGEPDGFPASDLGLKHAAPGEDLGARAQDWRPWRAYGALHLWASLND
jgi:AraC family transcriptional regulator of adaptative response / DNA-3-methyladenine glycosylase II